MPQVTNAPDEAAVRDVANHLNPRPFGSVVRTAYEHVDTPGIGDVRVACDLHRLVREQVPYRDYANFRHPPREALDRGANCVDSTALYCSLLIRAGFKCRITVLSSRHRGHMYPEVRINHNDGRIARAIQAYYDGRQQLRDGELELAMVETAGGCWVVADPATADCFGSATGLTHLGYLDTIQDGAPEFRCEVDRYEISYHRRCG